MTSRKPHWWRPWSGEASWRAQARKTASALDKETFLTWLDGGGAEAANLTFGEVWNRSAVMASWLFDVGLNTGERAMLVYAPGPEFFVAFVACLRAGILAVPNYPPDPAKLSRDLEKLDLVCTTCTAKVGLADNVVYALQLATRMWHSWPRIEWYNTDDIKGDERLSTESRFTLSEDTLADEIIKHLRTSDFSSALAEEDPHSQDNDDDELAFARASLRASIHEQECYHMVNFSPLSFLANPLMWMRAISKYRAIWTASPDFGYRLCTKRAANADISDIDLSCLVYCVAGVGQRCVPSLLREFAAYWAFHARLPDDGDRGIFVPNYGLAEHVVATCGENDGLVASRRRPDLTSCGSDFIINLCIVDSATRRILPSGMPGELWLSSSSIAKGYWGKPELSRETFRAQLDPDNGQTYLRTGDEAFIEDGHLFICGRIKDLIIIGGKNYYSDDVEFAATEAIGDAIRPGCVAAFSFTDDGEEEDECLAHN
ncbi:hypothetical protein CTAYLR_006963 [Chrysophaeum taylorii]|uniref:AMP-dependent synthetase/ligase domain-containing protein n=1 Tax=Chrysophaeum taylorii TaxID=2483200 RepID=A0AAD7UEH2_9STRA|nr:hypothetical protein CTAYLR_006963 [Chrysophaeum taylorii]